MSWIHSPSSSINRRRIGEPCLRLRTFLWQDSHLPSLGWTLKCGGHFWESSFLGLVIFNWAVLNPATMRVSLKRQSDMGIHLNWKSGLSRYVASCPPPRLPVVSWNKRGHVIKNRRTESLQVLWKKPASHCKVTHPVSGNEQNSFWWQQLLKVMTFKNRTRPEEIVRNNPRQRCNFFLRG